MSSELTISIGLLLLIIYVIAGLTILVPFALAIIFDKTFGSKHGSFQLNFAKFLISISSSILIALIGIKTVSTIFLQ